MSSPEAPKSFNTVFMGPLTHRETRLDALLNAKKDVRWSEEAENEYLENVKNRATEKVRALLLQAKRRSDEIVREAEQKAQGITQNAHAKASEIIHNAEQKYVEADQRFQATYNEAILKAQGEMQQILVQNQLALGESTAVVLLSIHEQVAKFYDAWKEDLKQLTIEAIQVGTGWVASTEKEQILKQMLDESVQKLMDKKNFIVRVNPADAELITQVLENSREKSWTMESSKKLEPGSLELESDNVFVKNSSFERQKFVQEILDNLVLPKNGDDDILNQKVTDTLTHEMQTNPLLARSYNQDENQANQPPTDLPDLGLNEMLDHSQNMPQQEMPQNFSENLAQDTLQDTQDFAPQDDFNQTQMDEQIPMADDFSQNLAQETSSQMQDQDFAPSMPEPTMFEPVEQENLSSMQLDENLQQPIAQDFANQEMPNFETKVIDELPEQPMEFDENFHSNTAQAEAQDMVEEFLGEQQDPSSLPTNVADDLLAEMGFDEKK